MIPSKTERVLSIHLPGCHDIPVGGFVLGLEGLRGADGLPATIDEPAAWSEFVSASAMHLCLGLASVFPNQGRVLAASDESIQTVPADVPVWIAALSAVASLSASGGRDNIQSTLVQAYIVEGLSAAKLSGTDLKSEPDWRVLEFAAANWPGKVALALPSPQELGARLPLSAGRTLRYGSMEVHLAETTSRAA